MNYNIQNSFQEYLSRNHGLVILVSLLLALPCCRHGVWIRGIGFSLNFKLKVLQFKLSLKNLLQLLKILLDYDNLGYPTWINFLKY